FKIITQIQPNNSEALGELSRVTEQAIDEHLNKGFAAFTEEKIPEAMEEYKKVLAFDPHNAKAIEYQRKAQDRVEVAFKEHMKAAAAQAAKKDRIKELSELDLALALKPDDAEAKARKEKVGGKLAEVLKLYIDRAKEAEDVKEYAEAATQYK